MIKCKKTVLAIATMLCLTASSVTALANSNSGYNRDDAVSYANDWAESNNPAYPHYDVPGQGDCTNFISQCLYAGGMSLTSEWKPGTGPWQNANNFRYYWSQNRDYDYRVYSVGVALHEWNSIYSMLWPGDIVNYTPTVNGVNATHSQIIIGYYNSSKYLSYAQHSTSSSGYYKDGNLKGYLTGKPSSSGVCFHLIKNGK